MKYVPRGDPNTELNKELSTQSLFSTFYTLLTFLLGTFNILLTLVTTKTKRSPIQLLTHDTST